MSSGLIWEVIVRFVDIGGIVVHHLLTFLFIQISYRYFVLIEDKYYI